MRADVFENLQGTGPSSKHYTLVISCVSQSLHQLYEMGFIIAPISQLRNLRRREIKYLAQSVQLGRGKTWFGPSKSNTGANGFYHHANPGLLEYMAIIYFLVFLYLYKAGFWKEWTKCQLSLCISHHLTHGEQFTIICWLTAKNMQIILGPYICIGNTKLRENVGNSRNKNPTVECFGLWTIQFYFLC